MYKYGHKTGMQKRYARGVSRTASSAADLYQRQAHASLSLPQLFISNNLLLVA